MAGREQKLGPYRLLNQIAVGGMAEIYSATAAGVGGFEKLVALKVIHPNYSEDPEFVQMLVDEAKLAVQLQHANIVQTFDLGFIENQYYIAMEMIDGIDLYKLLRRSSEKDVDFPFEVAAYIAEQAAQGLDYAHRKRDERGRPLEIVHRDISPQNILVSFDGEVKIVDFGIAKAARRAKQTAAGVIKGKYYYMSPEQAWGDPIDARTDIFSTGILLYEMLVGQMLYLEEDMDVLLEKVRKAAIAKPSTKRKDVPVQLESLVMKALAKRPQDRFQSAGELASALGRFLRARAPDFSRNKLAAWVKQALGSEPANQGQLVRDPKLSTAVRRQEIERDQNSLLFKLEDLKKSAAPKPSPAQKKGPAKPLAARQPNAPAPRRGDQMTSPVRMPDLAVSLGKRGDYEESDATIVDGTGETLMAMAPDDDTADAADENDLDESTRPMGNISQLRSMEDEEVLDSSDAVLDEPLSSLGDESDPKTDRTSLERVNRQAKKKPESPRLPGVRSLALSKTDSAPPQPLYGESGPLTNETETDGDETAERLKPRKARAAKAPVRSAFDEDGDDEETAVASSRAVPRPGDVSPSGPTQPAPVPFQRQNPPNPNAARPPPSRPQRSSGAHSLQAVPQPAPPQPTAPMTSAPPTALPLPPGLPVLPHSPSSPFSIVGGRTSDPGMHALRPRSRMPMVLIAAGTLIATLVVILMMTGSPPPKGSIEVASSPDGAEVKMDGTVIQRTTPLVITEIDPSRPHHVAVGKKGYDSWESDVRFEGETRQVRLQAILVPIVASIEIASVPPGAEAIVNGRIAGTTPTTVSELSPDSEVVVDLRLRGYRVAHRAFSFSGKRKLDVSIPLEKAR